MIQILHLEDDPVDSRLVADLLREEGLQIELERVHTLRAFKEGLERAGLNLIISDFTVPGMDALAALRLAQEMRPEIPLLYFSGTIGEELAIETLKRGATDYVLKAHSSRLVPAIRRALHEAEEHSRRKAGEDALARTTARLNGIVTSAMDAIISIDAGQRIVLFNPAAEKMFRLEATQALGRSINDFIPERFRAAHAHHVAEFSRTGVSNRAMGKLGVLHGLRSDGEEFPIEASISQTEVGNEKLFTVILRDITERKQAEEALHRSKDELERLVLERTVQLQQANANLQNFAHTAAHDLRSPLRAIKSFSAIVVEDYSPLLDAPGRDLLERISQSVTQMQQLLDDLLEYSKLGEQDLKLEAVSLQTAVRDALALLQADVQAKAAAISVQDGLPSIVGHPAAVVLLINNFVSNALKFVAPGVRPQIRIWAESVQSPKSKVQSREDSLHGREKLSTINYPPSTTPFIRLWVEDNGIGIRAEDIPKLFGVFQRLHGKGSYPGTGLGLAIVRKGAERMGGSVGVESQPDAGSRFWLEFKAFEP